MSEIFSEDDSRSDVPDGETPISVLGHAIMTRLSIAGEATGYDLSLVMGPPRNFIWEAKHSQIYPVLAELTKAACVEYVHVPQAGKPDKKVYRLTETGLERLRHWVRKGPTRTPIRDEFYVKLAAVWVLPPAEAIAMLEKQMAMYREEIDMMEMHLRDIESRAGAPVPLPVTSKFFGLHATTVLMRQSRERMLRLCRRLVKKLAVPH